MVREEYNLPLTKESYLHLREKADGVLISKTRYLLPLTRTDLTIELDVFDAPYEGFTSQRWSFRTKHPQTPLFLRYGLERM